MREDRRNFLKSSSVMVAAAAVWTTAGAGSNSSVSKEMGRRLSYLTPPSGSPPDLLARPSPPVTPFANLTLEEFRPPLARPLFEIAEAEGQGLNDEQWFELFRERFLEVARRLRTDGFLLPGPWTVRGEEFEPVTGSEAIRIEIGDLPDPESHQRFFEFRPRKVYINREVEFLWQFHEQYGENSYSWGYHNIHFDPETNTFRATRPCSPGPTFHAIYGEPILVRRINDLPEIGNQEGHARLVFALPSSTSHLHNAHTATESDGFPSDWINPGEYWDHHYANFPSANDDREKLSTLWYHHHRMDFTASNVYAGLDGFYLLFDEQDAHNADAPDREKMGPHESRDRDSWWLPSHDYDIPLIFHDLLFAQEKDGEAVAFSREQTTRWTFESKQDWDDYAGSDRGDLTSEGVRKAIVFKGFSCAGATYEPSPQMIFDGFNTDGIIGDRWTVNRRIQPSLEVEPRKYRLRLLNGGPSRFYEFFLHAKDAPADTYRTYTKLGKAEPTTELDHPFIVICGDGNFQPNPVLAHSVYLGVAQRVDVIIDFSQFEGSQVYLVNRLEQENGRSPTERKIDPKDFASDNDFYRANAFIEFKVGNKKQQNEPAMATGPREVASPVTVIQAHFPCCSANFRPSISAR